MLGMNVFNAPLNTIKKENLINSYMEREIKFRGLTSEGPQGWAFGFLYIDETGSYIKSGEKNKRFGTGVEVHPESVGQFTGLKDKNGKEIYEKDIVRIMTPANQIQKKSIISEIGFCDSSFCAYWRVTEVWEGFSVAPSSVYYLNCLIGSEQIEVIGNIYENKDLL